MVSRNAGRAAHGFVLLAVAALGGPPAGAQQEVESDGPYFHRPARAVYPPQVGEFRRSKVYRYDPEGKDVSASYDLATPEGRLLITVYIYPAAAIVGAALQESGGTAARARLCGEEFGAVKAAISRQHGDAAPIDEGEALALPGSEPGLRHRAVYNFRSPFDGREQELRSEAHLYCYVGGDWLVKYRVSAPAAVESRKAVEAFLRAGPWPGRPSPDTVARLGPARPGAAAD